ncbi:MAG TPA: Rieske 2Fe-2S domain-containing protein [Acidimicrobiia bacterium]|nr:Rieske 2Fe-2S domain-containing protein [Acidimicrobiia bacterium]
MRYETPAGPVSDLPPGTVKGAGRFAVGNDDGRRFAVTRRCRHLLADLAGGSIDDEGCLVCPWHGSRYDTETGRMVSGPEGFYDKIPGLEGGLKALTRFLPLGVGEVVERDGDLFVTRRG